MKRHGLVGEEDAGGSHSERAHCSVQVANTFTGAYIPTGITDEGLRQQLKPWGDVRTIELKNLVPGTFGGFTSRTAAAAVDEEVFPLFADKKWCCSGEQPMPVERLEWPYMLPPRLSARVQPPGTLLAQHWKHPVPKYIRPHFCDEIKQDPLNSKFLKLPNHPCTYLDAGIKFPETIPDVFAL
jgi:hypothetical protein